MISIFLKVKHELKPIPQKCRQKVFEETLSGHMLNKVLSKWHCDMMYKKHDEFLKQAEELQDYVDTKFRDEVLFEGFVRAVGHGEDIEDAVKWNDILDQVVSYD